MRKPQDPSPKLQQARCQELEKHRHHVFPSVPNLERNTETNDQIMCCRPFICPVYAYHSIFAKRRHIQVNPDHLEVSKYYKFRLHFLQILMVAQTILACIAVVRVFGSAQMSVPSWSSMQKFSTSKGQRGSPVNLYHLYQLVPHLPA